MKSKGRGKKSRKSKQSKVPKNYSEIYKNNLLQFVKTDKSQTNINLSELIESKIKELDPPKNDIENNYLIILLFSQYFIKGNDFIKEEYFSLIDNSIYKNFNEFLMNPIEAQHQKFLESFENLDSCANIIYLVCKKIVGRNPILRDKPVDFFFKIILKEHFAELKDSFDYPIKKDQKELINILASFIRIKYNYKDVTIKELMDLFKEEEPLDKLGNLDNLNSSVIKEDNNLINLNKEEVKKVSNEKSNQIEKEGNYSEQKPEEANEIKLEEINYPIKQENYNNIINQQSNTIIGKTEEIDFLAYLEKKKVEYEKMEYKTPVLDYIIKNKPKLKTSFFRITKDKNNHVDHLFDYLYWLLLRLNSDLINFQESKVGYFCFFDNLKKEYVEGIFSNIDLKFLYEKIISDDNFPPDDIYSPNEIIAKNAFKSRSLSFEYYLNNEIILNQLHAKERQRIIYIFKDVKDLEGLELGNIKIEENNRTLEVDGVILEKENKNIILNKSFFISDSINKFKISTDNPSKKTIINYIKRNENDDQEDNDKKNNIFSLDKNSLCAIEIKNQFPPYRPEEKNKEIYNKINANKYPVDFFNMVKSLVKKSLVFKDMFEQLNEKVDSIKLVLLYDAIYKFNYEKEMVKAINDIISIENEKLIEMLEFQCIFIKSSYLAGGYYNFISEQKKMEIKMQEMKEQLEKKDKEMKDKFDKMDGSIKDLIREVKQLKAQLKDKKEDDDKEKEGVKTNVDELSKKKEKEVHISVISQSKIKCEEGDGKDKKDNQ